MTQQIGKYQILEEIGHGGFGDVYLAEDAMLGSQVALKVLAPVYMRDPTVVRRFQQEARAAARLRHPNIVRIYDLGEGDGMLYLAMDYLPGRTLAAVIREEGPLPLEQVADLLAQVAAALDHAHGRGLTHRDVKPGNVMVSEDGHATLMDFGLVKAADHTQFTVLYRTADSEQFTTGGGTIGTPEYMAPEQADPTLGEVGPLSDLYALGIMAYQMVTGRVPFQASTPIATLRAHADLAPPPPSQWVEVPDEVAAVMLRTLAKQPEERWPSAGAFADALTAAVTQSQAGATQEAQLAALYAQVEEALDAQQWALALGLCGQIMARAPAYRQIEDLFEQATQGLTRQREWEAQQDELSNLYDEAIECMSTEDWDSAILLLSGIVDAGEDYAFRDVPKRLAEAREAQARAESERLARLKTLGEKVVATAEQLREFLTEWQELKPDRESVETAYGMLRELMLPVAEADGLEGEELQLEASKRAEDLQLQAKERAQTLQERVKAAVDEGKAASIKTKEDLLAQVVRSIPIWQQIGIEMVTIPAGEFLYGEKKERVHVPEYAMAKTPVTNAQYKAFVEVTGHEPPRHWKEGRIPKDKEAHPVVNVNWRDAMAFCGWAGCRLPSEQEWEKGARGSDGREYPWGDGWQSGQCNTSEAHFFAGNTTPVGQYPNGASPYGLLDMAGNVWEWSENWYDTEQKSKTLRGGSWNYDRTFARSAIRVKGNPDGRGTNGGFRCVVTPRSSP